MTCADLPRKCPKRPRNRPCRRIGMFTDLVEYSKQCAILALPNAGAECPQIKKKGKKKRHLPADDADGRRWRIPIFDICVNLRDLRAIPDSVAAGRAAFSAVKSASRNAVCRLLPYAPIDCAFVSHAYNLIIGSNFCQARSGKNPKQQGETPSSRNPISRGVRAPSRAGFSALAEPVHGVSDGGVADRRRGANAPKPRPSRRYATPRVKDKKVGASACSRLSAGFLWESRGNSALRVLRPRFRPFCPAAKTDQNPLVKTVSSGVSF